MPPNDFGLVLNDPLGSSKESVPYANDDAGLDDTGASENPEVTPEEPMVTQPDMGAVKAVLLYLYRILLSDESTHPLGCMVIVMNSGRGPLCL